MNTLIPVAGWVAAMLGLAGSVALVVFGFRAQHRPEKVRRSQLRFAVWCVAGGGVLAMAALETALLTNDFAMSYVAQEHSRETSLLFTITSAWSALGGSIVLWALVLGGYIAVVFRGVRGTEDRLGTGALAIMGLVSTFFFGLITTAANPFKILQNPPADGPGPNPLLRDHIMVLFHPPILYLGFVGFTVPFAFAMSALLLRRGGVEWLRRTRRANLVAWSFLTCGIVLGAWWSYEVLGWGGYWAWDPVENAALIPWLVATAFIHSAVVQVKRGLLQAWNFVLVLATFSLTILGTFLTRSNVIVSVHSFTQSTIGPALLAFFIAIVVGGFTLFALRGERVASPPRPQSLASREGAFLVNNLILTLLAFVVLAGTVYPVFVEAFTGAQVSVGEPFFDRMSVPLAFVLLLAVGIGPITPYRKATAGVLWTRLRWPLLVASVAAAAAVLLGGVHAAGVVGAVFLAVLITTSTVRQLLVTAPNRKPAGLWRLLRGQRAYWGGQLAHVGIAVVAVAIAVSGALATRTTVTLQPGQRTEFAGYSVTFAKTEHHRQPDRTAVDAHLVFRQDGDVAYTATPQLNRFPGRPQAVGTPSVWSTPTRDIYVSLNKLSPGRVTVSLYEFPMMSWLWTGGLLAAAGGGWALLGRRKRHEEFETEPERSTQVTADV